MSAHVAVIGLAALALGGCDAEPTHADMSAMLAKTAAFPGCDAATLRFVDREGGWQGGSMDVSVRPSADCRQRWLARLQKLCSRNAEGFHACSSDDGSASASVGLTSGGDVAVHLWSLT